MAEPAMLLTLQFLSWLDEGPRSYADVMDAWRTSCPRLSVWEDANIDGLVRLDRGPDERPVVVLTPLGRDVLEAGSVGI